MLLLANTGIDVAGKHAVVLGRSDIVGSPVCALLRKKDATVTQCHSKTQNLEGIVRAPLPSTGLIVRAGPPSRYRRRGYWRSLLRQGLVAQAGSCRDRRRNQLHLGYVLLPAFSLTRADPTKKSGQRLVGDVDYDSAVKVASFITPVPGGVGPMTVAMLMENSFIAAQRHLEKSQQRIVKGLKLPLKKDVPSDIEIAKSQTPKPINVLAAEIGIPVNDLEMYGRYKAKVKLEILESLQHRQYVFIPPIHR